MNILISGSHGFIGKAVVPALRMRGHVTQPLVRGTAAGVRWNPPLEGPAPAALASFDAIVHLAGENIASGRWTRERKKALRESRVTATTRLVRSLLEAPSLPRVVVCASAIGYYGDRGDQLLSEASAPGIGFLPDLCRAWEGATRDLERRGVRVVHLRFGTVLHPNGGALRMMLPLFRLGLGGRLGSGRQFFSWMSLPDVVSVVVRAVEDDRLAGAVNTVAPSPVRQAEFAAALARALRRPAALPAPAWALRVAFGEMADAALLSSARVMPERLIAMGHSFRHPTLDAALGELLS